ncbi:MAG: secretin and TonB N-terminal domain-containing protein [Syntrophales bacterium]|jgi:type IV pilus assembly protein PilQ
MKKNMPWIIILIACVMFIGSTEYAGSAPPEDKASQEAPAAKVQGTDFGYLEGIAFDRINGKERLTIVVSRPSGVAIESIGDKDLLVKMTKVFVPEELKRTLGEGKLSNIVSVVPSQRTVDGEQWALINIALRERVPYKVNQEGQNVQIDFDVRSLAAKSPAAEQKTPDVPKESPKVAEASKEMQKTPESPKEDIAQRQTKPPYGGPAISLDFQDANIKTVLRLLSEVGGVTIVSGDDVKGNVTVYMKKVPWDQALDTILDVQGLVKKQIGDVISVVTVEKMKKDEADRRAGEEDRLKAEAVAKKAEQDRLEERGRLRQISIEAKIVEAQDDFVRNLGVQWGAVSYNSIGGYSSALMAGTNPGTGSTSRSITWPYPTGSAFLNTDGTVVQSAALNYPAAVTGPSFGLILGGANAVIEAQLQALETNNTGKIISSPKITTMDNVKATIKQGQEIPYVTIDKDGNRSITFKEAVLKLEVKPKITPDGTISMEIKATNDAADYATGTLLGGNPPINKNEVESKIVVTDGDTIVIGGILKMSDQRNESGVPWFMKIPVLGWLFKTEGITKQRKQLMVFITPRIIAKEETSVDKLERPKGPEKPKG